jgi:hypothetical protein
VRGDEEVKDGTRKFENRLKRKEVEYRADIRSWDWDAIKAEAFSNIQELPYDDGFAAYAFIGSVFSIMPSGKFWVFPFAMSNVNWSEAHYDSLFREVMEEVAQEHDAWIENGEGDPCDLFVVWALENKWCKYCEKSIYQDDKGAWIDDTGGDVCGWNGGNEPHEPEEGDEDYDKEPDVRVNLYDGMM